VPDVAPFRITGESRYVAYINGTELARGPIRHGQRQLHYDHCDAAPLLRSGRNTIAVFARFYGNRTAWWLPTPPTFTLGGGCLVAELGLGDDRWIGTDEQWLYQEPAAWTPSAPLHSISPQIPEVFDARKLSQDWVLPEFDDTDWSKAHPIPSLHIGGTGRTTPPSDPYGAILPRPIPQLTASPTSATRWSTRAAMVGEGLESALRDFDLEGDEWGAKAEKVSGLIVADFERIVSGTVRLILDAPAGAVIIGALVEVPSPAALSSAQKFTYTTRGEDDVFEGHDPCGGRYVVLISDEPVSIEELEVVERHRPRPKGASFACSDDALTRIHAVGLRTVDLTAHDAYIDCPTREQRAWTGDSVVHQSVDLVTNPDWSLARRHPQLAARARVDGLLPMVAAGDAADPELVTIPDWSLHWIRSVHNLYRYTGDRELVAGLLPTVESVLRWFTDFLGADRLVHEVTGWVLIDWSPVQVRGTSAALNALWARGLADFSEMSDWLGDAGRARWARGLQAGVRAGFEVFWDPERGVYRDHAVDGLVQPAVSEHTAAAAVCADLVPEDRRGLIRDFLLARDSMLTRSPVQAHGSDADGAPTAAALFAPPEPDWDVYGQVIGAQPFFRYVVHDALALLGAADRIAELCRDWDRLLAIGPSAFRETWEGGSFCHGWSSTPSRDLITYVLGITPAAPGYERVRVAPRLGALEWAEGVVPTPRGPVRVRADRNGVSVESPIPIDIDLPGQETKSLGPGTHDIPR
jgi:alpha-L-rhamnosidase